MFENYRTFKTTFAGRELMVETGKVCGLANGSCWIHYGETVVMVNVAASPIRIPKTIPARTSVGK